MNDLVREINARQAAKLGKPCAFLIANGVVVIYHPNGGNNNMATIEHDKKAFPDLVMMPEDGLMYYI